MGLLNNMGKQKVLALRAKSEGHKCAKNITKLEVFGAGLHNNTIKPEVLARIQTPQGS